jgi:hypothetical protein
VARLTWRQDTFAYADSYDSAAGRYRGLEAGRRPNVQLNSESVVVKPDVASGQMEKEAATQTPVSSETDTDGGTRTIGFPESSGVTPGGRSAESPVGALSSRLPGRFHGSATLNATRLSRDVDSIATSVVQHLAGLVDARVTVTLEIQAEIPSGAPENVVRTVTENCRTLKFDSQGFEDV